MYVRLTKINKITKVVHASKTLIIKPIGNKD